MRIRWTQPAAHDLTEICDYIKEHTSPEAGRKVALQIYETLDTLARFPNLGRRGRKSNTRELIFQGLPYVAIYRIRGDVGRNQPYSAWSSTLALTHSIRGIFATDSAHAICDSSQG